MKAVALQVLLFIKAFPVTADFKGYEVSSEVGGYEVLVNGK